MKADFEKLLGKREQDIMSCVRGVVINVNKSFKEVVDPKIRSAYRANPEETFNYLMNHEQILKYITTISNSQEYLDFYLSEYLSYAIVVEEMADNLDIIQGLIQKYKDANYLDASLENIEKMFWLALNIVMRANLEKILDVYCNVVYNLKLPKEHDYFVLRDMLDQSLIYLTRYTHVHHDSDRCGYIAVRKLSNDINNGFHMTDPVMVTYNIVI